MSSDYSAPEELIEMQSPSLFLIDSWALGVIIYQLCTGREHPFLIKNKSRDLILEIF